MFVTFSYVNLVLFYLFYRDLVILFGVALGLITKCDMFNAQGCDNLSCDENTKVMVEVQDIASDSVIKGNYRYIVKRIITRYTH